MRYDAWHDLFVLNTGSRRCYVSEPRKSYLELFVIHIVDCYSDLVLIYWINKEVAHGIRNEDRNRRGSDEKVTVHLSETYSLGVVIEGMYTTLFQCIGRLVQALFFRVATLALGKSNGSFNLASLR